MCSLLWKENKHHIQTINPLKLWMKCKGSFLSAAFRFDIFSPTSLTLIALNNYEHLQLIPIVYVVMFQCTKQFIDWHFIDVVFVAFLLSPSTTLKGDIETVGVRPSGRLSGRPSEKKLLSQPQFFTDPYQICIACLYH